MDDGTRIAAPRHTMGSSAIIKATKIVCWCVIALDVAATIRVHQLFPNRGQSLATLVPWAFTLAALYSAPRRWLAWVAILLNGLPAVLGLLLLVLSFLGQIVPWVGFVVGLALMLLAALNIAAIRASHWRHQ